MPALAPDWPPRTILVAVDTDPEATLLVQRAATLALLLGARLVVVHAVCIGTFDEPTPTTGLLEVLEGLDVDAYGHVARWVKGAAAEGVEVTALVRHGAPARVLTEAIRTERADLIVLGSKPRSRIMRAMLGDLHQELSDVGGCAVLRVPVGLGELQSATPAAR